MEKAIGHADTLISDHHFLLLALYLLETWDFCPTLMKYVVLSLI